jgi:hypothetical protein
MAYGRSMMLACAGFAAATLSLPAQGDMVQGLATVGTTAVSLACGMAVADTAPNGPLISVLLSDKPVDAKTFAEDTRTGPGERLVAGLFDGAWASQHIAKKLSGVAFTIGPNGLMLDQLLVGGPGHTFSVGNDHYLLELKSRSPRLVGTLKTYPPVVDLGGRKVGVDAWFDMTVTVR